MSGNEKRSGSPIHFAVLGEIMLLVIVAGFLVYLFVESLAWPLGAALMPRIIACIGLPFVVLRGVMLARRTEDPKAGIMDTGFALGEETAEERKRFIRICVYIVGLYLAIWVFGFHVALPLGIFFYLYRYSRIGFLGSLAGGLFFLALIIGLYDHVMHTRWEDPLIVRIFPMDWLRPWLGLAP